MTSEKYVDVGGERIHIRVEGSGDDASLYAKIVPTFEEYLEEEVFTMGEYGYEDEACKNMWVDYDRKVFSRDIERAIEDDGVVFKGIVDDRILVQDAR